MNQRERFLAIGIGGLLLVLGMQWMFGKYRAAVKLRTGQIANLENQKLRLEEELLNGAYADRQMGEYMVRSLPPLPERAQSDYQRWLLDLVQSHGLVDASIDPTTSMPVGDLYQRFGFRVSGKTTLPQLTELLYAFYRQDYLHRIREIGIRPVKAPSGKTSNALTLELGIDAIALKAAPEEIAPSKEPSWKVASDPAVYRDSILNRNFFSPPNAAPRYAGSSEIRATIGADMQTELKFEDPEGHGINYALVGEVPEFIRFDASRGTLTAKPGETGKYDLVVQATDDGFPPRTTEQRVTLEVTDPPPPPEPPAMKPGFDEATQTVLTGLVQGRDDWTAWMNIRTRGETLKLRVGDTFEIGSIKGAVVEVTQRYAVLEMEGRRFTLRPSGNLAEAAKTASED